MFLLAGDNVRVFDQLGSYIGPTIAIPVTPGNGIQTVQSSADGTKVVISVDGETSLYDAVTGAKLDVPPLPLMASVVSPNGVAVGSTVEGDLWIFDPDTLEKLDELPGLHGYAELLTLNADGTTLAAENESDGIRIYDVPTRTQLGENIPDVDGALGYFAMRPDGKELAVPYGSLGLVLWDLDPQHWLDAACALAGRNLTQDDCCSCGSVARQPPSQWRKFNSRAARLSTAARSLPSSRPRTLNIPRGTSRGSSTPPSRCMG